MKPIVKDRGWNRMKREIAKGRRNQVVAVGVLQSDAGVAHQDGGVTVGEVATFNEFGTADGRVPERSFVRSTVDENEREYTKRIAQLQGEVLAGRVSSRTALGVLGEEAVSDIRRKMTDGIPPPNAPATVAKKGSSTPLIDTGQLRQAINYEVRD